MERLGRTAERHGAIDVGAKISELSAFLGDGLARVEAELRALPEGDTPLHASARHLVETGGKRLRPMCALLAARAGGEITEAARAVAVAVELVHAATLLHDDVVDVGELRRGAPAARVLYGNAASVFAGDYLLVDALRRVLAAAPRELPALLSLLREMLEGEALQLDQRGRLDGSLDTYLRIVRGKTASLFRFALAAGARAGGAREDVARALGDFGEELGLAFQVIDDALDFSGDPAVVGKSTLTDLREGKATYPLLVAMGVDPRIGAVLRAALATADGLDDAAATRLAADILATGAVERSVEFAASRAAEARGHLDVVPDADARRALSTVVTTLTHRRA
ncbi:MAG: polyprenyl synthetase family protein [Polyangiaceae bacterium]|nr:polyprenyl synthetase family protein [Polyangiaceae bacterium]